MNKVKEEEKINTEESSFHELITDLYYDFKRRNGYSNLEISQKRENRNYLFHINSSKKYKNVWSVIPGKFTLAFSMAPEFYRVVYKKNPRKFFNTTSDTGDFSHLIEETVWGEIQKKK